MMCKLTINKEYISFRKQGYEQVEIVVSLNLQNIRNSFSLLSLWLTNIVVMVYVPPTVDIPKNYLKEHIFSTLPNQVKLKRE